MKQGLISLEALGTEVARQQRAKRDFMADTRSLALTVDAKNLAGVTAEVLPVRNYAHGQIAEDLKVPKAFYDRLRAGHPDVLSNMVNTLFAREPQKRMVRTLDGQVRAVLSNRFRPLDNYDLMNAVLPLLMGVPEIRFESVNVTETNLYIKAVFPRVQGEVGVGEVVQSGIEIGNSEVGKGKIKVAPLLYILSCKNGAVFNALGQSKLHIGRQIEVVDAAYELLSDETKQKDDIAFWAKIQDITKATMERVTFEKILDKAKEAKLDRIGGTVKEVTEVVEVTAKRFGYSEATKEGIMEALLKDGDFSRWGLSNAITYQSQQEEDYDMASQLERDGGRVIELPASEWAVTA